MRNTHRAYRRLAFDALLIGDSAAAQAEARYLREARVRRLVA